MYIFRTTTRISPGSSYTHRMYATNISAPGTWINNARYMTCESVWIRWCVWVSGKGVTHTHMIVMYTNTTQTMNRKTMRSVMTPLLLGGVELRLYHQQNLPYFSCVKHTNKCNRNTMINFGDKISELLGETIIMIACDEHHSHFIHSNSSQAEITIFAKWP